MSTSPRVPMVSRRAASGRLRSPRRRRGTRACQRPELVSRRRQAGSILKKVNLAKVRSAIGLTIAIVRRFSSWGRAGGSLNFFGGTAGPPGLHEITLARLFRTPPHDSGPVSWCFARGGLSRRTRLSLGRWAERAGGADLSRHHPGKPRLRLPLRHGPSALGRDCSLGKLCRAGRLRPADIVPGLLQSTLRRAGIGVRGGSERLVLFRRLNLGLHRPSIEKASAGPPAPRPNLRSAEWNSRGGSRPWPGICTATTY